MGKAGFDPGIEKQQMWEGEAESAVWVMRDRDRIDRIMQVGVRNEC